MKTLLCFSLLTFLILSGCSKIANDPAAKQDENLLKSGTNNYTVPMTFKEAFTSTVKQIPVECDGVVIDHLTGTLDVFCRMFGHYDPNFPGDDNKFISLWMIHNYSGILTSTSGSGEIFDIQGVKKMDMVEKDFSFHLNVKGNLGSHYILSASGTNAPNYTFTVEKAVCPGSN